MSEADDPRLAAVERRLVDRGGFDLSPGHRDRTLAAVRDTLAGKAERRGPLERAGKGIDPASVAALVAIAVSTMLTVVVPWLAVTRPVAPLLTEPRLMAQARAAGIELPVEWLAATSREPVEPVAHPSKSPSARLHDVWRLRNHLRGEL
jgi:hypothetical protein